MTAERPLNRFFRKLGRIMLAIVLDVLSVAPLFDKSRGRYWQAVPFRRLSGFLYGVFCFFSATGFLLDLFSWYRFPEWGVLLFAVLCGLNAAVLFVIVLRRRFWLLPYSPYWWRWHIICLDGCRESLRFPFPRPRASGSALTPSVSCWRLC